MTITGPMPLPRIVGGANDILVDADGHRCIDLFSGHGTVWLGHATPRIAAALAEQAAGVWNTGGLKMPIHAEAESLLQAFFPASHYPAALYSTGMEAAEFALRMARSVTKKSGAVGFARNLHGKSLATAQLGWDNSAAPPVADFHRLPFLPKVSESEALDALERTLAGGNISAVFIEPIQGSGGGHSASPDFYDRVIRRCRAHGALAVFDEMLTGFYRTGPPFFFSELTEVPDQILVGKAMGNGFPVSAVIADRKYPVEAGMFPGSTYAGNPLAAAAVAATLREMRILDLPTRVAAIEKIIVAELRPLETSGIALRGRGALWVIELPPPLEPHRLASCLYQRGVLVSYAGNLLRILPAATIDLDHLKEGCALIAEVLTGKCHDET